MLLRMIAILMFGASLLAQDYVDNIIKRNPFDPDRGQTSEEPDEEPEIVIPTRGMPTLDGTIIIGDIKYALFTYTADGRPKSTRIKVDETIEGYTLAEVSREAVQLKNQSGQTVMLTMYSDKDKARGGTKAAGNPRSARDKAIRKGEPEIITTREEDDGKDDKSSRFRKRETPTQPQPRRDVDPEKAKKTSMDNKI